MAERFSFEVCGKKYENCFFVFTRYNDPDNLALFIKNDDETVAIECSMNLNDKTSDDIIRIKDFRNAFFHFDMAEFLIQKGIIKRGAVTIDIYTFETIKGYELTEKGLEMFKGV